MTCLHVPAFLLIITLNKHPKPSSSVFCHLQTVHDNINITGQSQRFSEMFRTCLGIWHTMDHFKCWFSSPWNHASEYTCFQKLMPPQSAVSWDAYKWRRLTSQYLTKQHHGLFSRNEFLKDGTGERWTYLWWACGAVTKFLILQLCSEWVCSLDLLLERSSFLVTGLLIVATNTSTACCCCCCFPNMNDLDGVKHSSKAY